jgi:ABC-type branched-subunit amino acid transport system substrate-binding protein
MRRIAILCAAVLMISTACGASGSDSAEEGPSTTAEAAVATDGGVDEADFGDLEAPCGSGDFSVDPAEQGRGADKLYIGVGNDRTSTIRPGLQKTIWDSSLAFAEWCNAQGGVGGLQIEVVDLPAAIFDVEAAMTTACTDVFAMVGGGMAQDNLQFSGKDGSDFHQCGMIDIPAYAVSTEKSGSNGQVQPIPNPATSVNNSWLRDFQQLYPEEAATWSVAWADIPSLEIPKVKYQAAIEDIGGIEEVSAPSYPVAGTTDWAPLGLSIMDKGASSLTWVGDSADLSKVLATMRQQGWRGTPVLETTAYDPTLFASGPDAVEGSVVRMYEHPFEEADQWPATQKYVDLVDEFVPDGVKATLGMDSMSAWLLFVTAANACGEKNDGVLDRACIIEQAAAVDDWTGGGLHATTDPANGPQAVASPCSMLLVVKDGTFERLFPEIDGPDDDGGGFHCPADGVTQVTASVGEAKIDPTRPS